MSTESPGGLVLRVSAFRVPPDAAGLQSELRSLSRSPWGHTRWIGRRMMDDPGGPEVIVVSTWRSAEEMEREVESGQHLFSPELRAAVATMTTRTFEVKAFGSWKRESKPVLIRIFTGTVVEGDPGAFDDAAAATYVSMFESNPRCAGIVAAIGDDGVVVLASLWTNWDAVVTATAGDLRQVLPLRLPGYEVAGNAVHYEVITAA